MFDARRAIAEELNVLRRKCASEVLDVRMLDEYGWTLTYVLGGGDSEAAFERLQAIEPSEGQEHLLDAALIAFGFGPYKGNQTDRWLAWLTDQHPDVENLRTARRWCDLGFDLIIQSITAARQEPLITVTVTNGSVANTVRFTVTASWANPPSGSREAVLALSWGNQARELVLNGATHEFTTDDLELDARLGLNWPTFVNPERWHMVEGVPHRLTVSDWSTGYVDYVVRPAT